MPMGSGMPKIGRFKPVKAFTLPAMKSQYLKNTRMARLKNTDEATASLAFRSSERQRSTSIPWV